MSDQKRPISRSKPAAVLAQPGRCRRYRILLRTKSKLQRSQRQLADQAARPEPLGASSTPTAVGDDAAQPLMPEDLWSWTRIDDQMGQARGWK